MVRVYALGFSLIGFGVESDGVGLKGGYVI